MKSLVYVLKIVALFISLFIINLLVMKFLSFLGYFKFAEVNGLLLSPLLTTMLLVFFYKRQGKKINDRLEFHIEVSHFERSLMISQSYSVLSVTALLTTFAVKPSFSASLMTP